MRKVKMLATWSETGNTSGDVAGFDDATAAHLVARGLGVYADTDEKKAPAKRVPTAPPADKMVRTSETKAPELTATDDDKPKPTTTRRRRRKPPTPAKPIGENEGD
jgi:hypothetical protein